MLKDRIIFLLYCFSFSTLYIFKFLEISEGNVEELFFIYRLVKLVIVPSIMVLIIILSLSFSDYLNIYLILVSLICLVTSFFSNDLSILSALLAIIAVKKVDLKRFFYLLFILSLIIILFVIVKFFYDYLNSTATIVFDENYGKRYTFGFNHPNSFSVRIFILLSLYILVRKAFNVLDYIFWILILVGVYAFTHSRTGVIIGFLLISYMYMYENSKFLKIPFLQFFSKWLFIFLLLISYYVSSNYQEDVDIYSLLNKIFSGRVSMANKLMTDFKIGLFPQNISDYLLEQNLVLDNLYVYSLVSLGFIFSGMCAFLFYRLFNLLFKHELYKESILIFTMLLYALMEKVFTDVYFNIILLFFSFLIYKQNLFFYSWKKKYE